MLASDLNFLFGVLLEEAKKTGGPVSFKKWTISFVCSYSFSSQGTEFQVRNINSMWGDGVVLNDYASKQMAGMVKGYYKQRWKLYMSKVIEKGKNYISEVNELEIAFANHSRKEQVVPVGDTLVLCSKALKKYGGNEVSKKYATLKGQKKKKKKKVC